MAMAGVSAAYATCGGNQAIAFGEELAQPHRHMGGVILIAGVIGAFATALPVVAVVLGVRDLPSILKSPAPLSSFIASVAGPAAERLLDLLEVLQIRRVRGDGQECSENDQLQQHTTAILTYFDMIEI